MLINSELADAPGSSKAESLADEVTRLSDTIRACDRLCLLSSRSVARCTIPVGDANGPEKTENDARPVVFIPSVSVDLQSVSASSAGPEQGRTPRSSPLASGNPHPTTSAQCIAALQKLMPIISRFQLGTHESKDVTFHPIHKASMEAFKPEPLSGHIRDTVERGLRAFRGAKAPADQHAPIGLSSVTFGSLHPFTAAQVLRAIAPSREQFMPVWWKSLFVVLWFLNRRIGSLSGYPNTQTTDSPSTAFLTGKCVDAIETIYRVFERRQNRFKKLFDLMTQLKNVQEMRDELANLSALISEANFRPGYDFRDNNLAAEVRSCIREIALDTGMTLYQDWNRGLDKWEESRQGKGPDSTKNAEFLVQVAESFIEAVREHSGDLANAQALAGENLAEIHRIHKTVELIHQGICDGLDDTGPRGEEPIPTREDLPEWVCSADYWDATRKALLGRAMRPGDGAVARSAGIEVENHWRNLENHWHRHQDAVANATRTAEVFGKYLRQILEGFEALRKQADELPRTSDGTDNSRQKKVQLFLTMLSENSERLQHLREQLWRDMETGIRWAEVLMNRQLTYASSGMVSQFDASELAHAVRVLSRDETRLRLEIIFTAVRAICGAQRPDGTWTCQQPFYWTAIGYSASTLSIETAWAMVSTINELLRNPERFSASLEEVSATLGPAYQALERFFRWLSASIQSFPTPPALLDRSRKDSSRERPPFYGWCSDRVHEPGRIHSWATANAIEFLVEFRILLQERINSLLRTKFLSHHPAELKALSEVEPTDLGNPNKAGDRGPVISTLLRLLRDHKALELAEGPWLPSAPPRSSKIPFFSAVLYGPPGTSKTFLAKAVAAELGWPLISLSPSDFLSRGERDIEARAQEIFTSLGAGSRLVYFFDEVDELIRSRRETEQLERSVFSFLTPSFLTKLQDFRDAAKENEFIFILGTNYLDRIDSAAKRSGRIDQQLLVVYPDEPSRAYIILQQLLKAIGKDEKKLQSLRRLRSLALRESPAPRANEAQPVARSPRPASSDRQASDRQQQLEGLHGYLLWLRVTLAQIMSPNKSNGSRNKSFLDTYAEFTGFLSYPTLGELTDRLIQLTIKKVEDYVDEKGNPSEEIKRGLRDVIEVLDAIDWGVPERFKSEIELSDYSNRPKAAEEIARIAKLMPQRPLPWPIPWRNAAARSGVEKSKLHTQISGLAEAMIEDPTVWRPDREMCMSKLFQEGLPIKKKWRVIARKTSANAARQAKPRKAKAGSRRRQASRR